MTDPYRIRSDETWTQVRDDYLKGDTAEQVCARYDVGLSAFRQRARSEEWRRSDQDDPAPLKDDLDDLPDMDLPDLVRLAFKRLTQALLRASPIDAARWQKIHDTLHARAEADAVSTHYESLQGPHPVFPDRPSRPRLNHVGENVHDVHSDSAGNPDEPGLSRAERRRRMREAQRRR
ncbi:MAG: hypothetical protein DCF29_15085 [Alphaproteobacteria bacterium]|nr:MAG: hypothetical protein DCF29_15085 [Alphaproteobacteria bacterium]